jgi:hypothetical protein
MLKAVESKNFICDGSYYKHMMLIHQKDNPNFRLHINATDIDELIELLQEAKKQFR